MKKENNVIYEPPRNSMFETPEKCKGCLQWHNGLYAAKCLVKKCIRKKKLDIIEDIIS